MALPNPIVTKDGNRVTASMPDSATVIAWDVEDGTLIEGALDQQRIIAEYPPGQNWLNVEVADTAGKHFSMSIPVNI